MTAIRPSEKTDSGLILPQHKTRHIDSSRSESRIETMRTLGLVSDLEADEMRWDTRGGYYETEKNTLQGDYIYAICVGENTHPKWDDVRFGDVCVVRQTTGVDFHGFWKLRRYMDAGEVWLCSDDRQKWLKLNPQSAEVFFVPVREVSYTVGNVFEMNIDDMKDERNQNE